MVYRHGRTETIRPCTIDTKALAELYHNADLNDPQTQKAIDTALRKAIETHYTVRPVHLSYLLLIV